MNALSTYLWDATTTDDIIYLDLSWGKGGGKGSEEGEGKLGGGSKGKDVREGRKGRRGGTSNG